jgi:hypothetical protein
MEPSFRSVHAATSDTAQILPRPWNFVPRSAFVHLTVLCVGRISGVFLRSKIGRGYLVADGFRRALDGEFSPIKAN